MDRIYADKFRYVDSFLAHRVENIIDQQIEASRNLAINNLLDKFLVHSKMQFGDPGTYNVDGEFNDLRWQSLVSAIQEFLPRWGPMADNDERAEVQLLTVEKSRTHLRLRAESGKIHHAGKSHLFRSRMRIVRDQAICGIALDMEENGESFDHLYVNPSSPEHAKRYASYLYRAGIVPQSELIIPLRWTDKILLLINLEHTKPNAFTDYHRECAKAACLAITRFVNLLDEQEQQLHDDEKQFRYMLLKVINRLTKTQAHSLKGNFGDLKTSIRVLEERLQRSTDKRVTEELAALKENHARLVTFTDKFGTELVSFVNFGKKNLQIIANSAVADMKLDGIISRDNISFESDNIPADIWVYCSDIAREHVYNVFTNSIEQLAVTRINKRLFSGRIELRFGIEESVDLSGKQQSYNMAVLEIGDNAGGVAQEHESKIFDVGYTTKAASGGTGFGLPSARDYFLRIGGGFEFINNFPHGCTVKLKFPIYTEELHDFLVNNLNAAI